MYEEPDPKTLGRQVYGESGVPPMETNLASMMAMHQFFLESHARVQAMLRTVGIEWHPKEVDTIIRTMREPGRG